MNKLLQTDLLTLISQDTSLKRVAGTKGGEYAGPCPQCGGEDRFRVWPHSDRPGYWCRQCGKRGDAIQYLRDFRGMTFNEACAVLNIANDEMKLTPRGKRPPTPRLNPSLARHNWEARNPAWQAAARAFVWRAADTLLDSRKGRPARDYLQGRGIGLSVAMAHGLGYNLATYRGRWGDVDVTIPANSLIIPWEETLDIYDGVRDEPAQYVKVKYRRLDVKQYGQAKGGADGLYGWPYVRKGVTIVLVEAELCALSLWQAVPGLVIPLATGSADGARLYRSIARLALAQRLILAFDDDADGEAASTWWKVRYPEAIRLRPTRHDINNMLTSGDDIAAWITSAIV